MIRNNIRKLHSATAQAAFKGQLRYKKQVCVSAVFLHCVSGAFLLWIDGLSAGPVRLWEISPHWPSAVDFNDMQITHTREPLFRHGSLYSS